MKTLLSAIYIKKNLYNNLNKYKNTKVIGQVFIIKRQIYR